GRSGHLPPPHHLATNRLTLLPCILHRKPTQQIHRTTRVHHIAKDDHGYTIPRVTLLLHLADPVENGENIGPIAIARAIDSRLGVLHPPLQPHAFRGGPFLHPLLLLPAIVLALRPVFPKPIGYREHVGI